jgi:glycosyltransferase involved in cell wall biosynthesis
VAEQLEINGIVVSKKVVIDIHGGSYFYKAIKYIKFYSSIIYSCFFLKYDLIFAHQISFTALPLIFCKIFIKKPLVANAHGNDVIPTNFLKKLLIPFARIAAHLSKLVIVPSAFFQREACKTYRIKYQKTYVYPSGGVNKEIFNRLNKKNAKTESGVSEDEFIITYVSRIDKGKGWDIFLKALYLILKELPAKGLIVGWGDEEKHFEKMVSDLKISDSIKSKFGLPRLKLNEIYNASDIFVFPTMLIESLGLVGLEAMATGTPVIGSKIGGIQDYLVDGENGFFFEPGNSVDLKDKIFHYYYLNDTIKAQMSLAAIETVKKYDATECDKELAKKFKELRNTVI